MLSYSVQAYILELNNKMVTCVSFLYMCGWRSAIGYRILAKQHRGSFLRHPV